MLFFRFPRVGEEPLGGLLEKEREVWRLEIFEVAEGGVEGVATVLSLEAPGDRLILFAAFGTAREKDLGAF